MNLFDFYKFILRPIIIFISSVKKQQKDSELEEYSLLTSILQLVRVYFKEFLF